MKIKGVATSLENVKKNYVFFCMDDNIEQNKIDVAAALEKGASICYGINEINVENFFQVNDINHALVKTLSDVKKINYDNFNFVALVDPYNKVLNLVKEICQKKNSYFDFETYIIKGKKYNCDKSKNDFENFFEFLKKSKRKRIDNVIIDFSLVDFKNKRLGELDFYITTITCEDSTGENIFEMYNAIYKIANKDLIADTNNIITLGQRNSTFRISNFKEQRTGMSFLINDVKLKSKMLGIENANSIAYAFAICRLLNVSIKDIDNVTREYLFDGASRVVSEKPSIIYFNENEIPNIESFLTKNKYKEIIIITTNENKLGNAINEKLYKLKIITSKNQNINSKRDVSKIIVENKVCNVKQIERAIDFAVENIMRSQMIIIVGENYKKNINEMINKFASGSENE